jgi:hypothetical protein
MKFDMNVGVYTHNQKVKNISLLWCWVWFIATEPKRAWLNIFHQYCHKVTGMAKHIRRMFSLCSGHKRQKKNLQNSKQIPHCFAQTRSTKVVTWQSAHGTAITSKIRRWHTKGSKRHLFITKLSIYRSLPLSPPTAHTFVFLTNSTICDWKARLNNNNNNNNNNNVSFDVHRSAHRNIFLQ